MMQEEKDLVETTGKKDEGAAQEKEDSGEKEAEKSASASDQDIDKDTDTDINKNKEGNGDNGQSTELPGEKKTDSGEMPQPAKQEREETGEEDAKNLPTTATTPREGGAAPAEERPAAETPKQGDKETPAANPSSVVKGQALPVKRPPVPARHK